MSLYVGWVIEKTDLYVLTLVDMQNVTLKLFYFVRITQH